MTREEAIQELKYAQAMCLFDPSTGEVGFRNTEDERQHEAFGIATRSLEAWDKVLDFLYMTEDSFMNTRNIIEKGILQHNKNTIEVIEKCIEEVES